MMPLAPQKLSQQRFSQRRFSQRSLSLQLEESFGDQKIRVAGTNEPIIVRAS